MTILDKIDSPDDLKTLEQSELLDLDAPGTPKWVLSAFLAPSGVLSAESREEINR